jgi:hypothetical protein
MQDYSEILSARSGALSVCGSGGRDKAGHSTLAEHWPPQAFEFERRFGQPHTKLFPYLGRKVWTPSGPGTLVQVFAERVTVVLDSEMSKCSFFPPAEIQPVSWELP